VNTNDPVIADNTVSNDWIYEVPPRTDAKVQLLTVGRIATYGSWYGELGEHFIAYCPLPKRNKELERRLGLL
jgi:hypothetical protein